MKKILHLTILIVLFNTIANSQCTMLNPGFENWSQQEFPLESDDGSIITGSAFLPDDYQSLYKFAFGLFVLAFGDSTDIDYFENNTQDFLGIARSEDASEGNYALKLYGNEDLNFSDIAGVNDCNDLPESFSIDVKHVGEGLDTLQIFAFWDEGINLGTDEDNEPNAGAAFSDGISDDGNYFTITIPTQVINNNPSDTVSIHIFAEFEDFNKTYFLFDNLRFNYSASTKDNASKTLIEIGPSPTRGDIFVKTNIQNGGQIAVFDGVGRMIEKSDFNENKSLDISGNPSGIYLFKIFDNNSNLIETKKVLLVN